MAIRGINFGRTPFVFGIPEGFKPVDFGITVEELENALYTLSAMEGDIMDSGEGRMVKVDSDDHRRELRKRYPKSKGIFKLGEIVEIKGSSFKVARINPFGILLKVQKQD